MSLTITTPDNTAIQTSGEQLTEADNAVIDMWLDESKSEKKYRRELLAFFDFANCGITDATFQNLKDYKNYLGVSVANGQIKQSTANHKLTIIRGLFSKAKAAGYTQFNVSEFLRLPEATAAPMVDKVITCDQMAVVLAAAAQMGARQHLFFRLAYYTGARVSEITGLTWGQVNIGATAITFENLKNKDAESRTKTIFINNTDLWTTLLDTMPADAEASTFVFATRTARAIDRFAVYKWTNKITALTGIKLTPHTFRHAHATHTLANGENVTDVAQTLGHKTLAMMSTYAHIAKGYSTGGGLDV